MVLSACCLIGAALLATAPAQAAEPKNVIFVLVDTLRADRLGAYGSEREGVSPNFDAFAAQSTVFEQAVSQANWTIPSIASLFSGHYPSAHKVNLDLRNQDGVPDSAILSPAVETLAERFSAGGFDTAAFIRNGVINPKNGFDQGFDSWRMVLGPAARAGSAGAATDESIAWLRAHEGDADPFFLYVHYQDPHSDYRAPDPFFGRYLDAGYSEIDSTTKEMKRLILDEVPNEAGFAGPMLARYDEEVAYWDSQFGRLLRHLESTGRMEDTVIVVTADHGEQFNEHGSWMHHHLWQENVHVPMVVRLPGQQPRRIDGWAEMFDLGPTVLELVGLEPIAGTSARSLASVVRGGKFEPDFAFSEHHRMVAVIEGQSKIIVGNRYPGVSTDIPTTVFDLAADPTEQNNLAAREQPRDSLVARWRALQVVQAQYSEELMADKAALDEVEAEMLRAMGYLE